MGNNKLNSKYYPWIWVGLVFSTIVDSMYELYLTFSSMQFESRTEAVLSVLDPIVTIGIRVGLCFLIAYLLYTFAFRRHARAISPNDFIYLVMLFTAIARFINGIIGVFAILLPKMYTLSAELFPYALHAAAMLTLFLAVFKRLYKLNPVETYNCFRSYFTLYCIGLGVLMLSNSSVVLMLSDGSAFSAQILATLYENGYTIDLSPFAQGVAIATICLYVAYVISIIVLGEIFRSRAAKFRDPQTRENYYQSHPQKNTYSPRNDVNESFPDVFGDGDGGDDNVFDEFDL